MSRITGLKRAREATLESLQYGELYRIVGAFHVLETGTLRGAGGVVAGRYEGQVTGRPFCFLFSDTDKQYMVTDTRQQYGVQAAKVYKLRGPR